MGIEGFEGIGVEGGDKNHLDLVGWWREELQKIEARLRLHLDVQKDDVRVLALHFDHSLIHPGRFSDNFNLGMGLEEISQAPPGGAFIVHEEGADPGGREQRAIGSHRRGSSR